MCTTGIPFPVGQSAPDHHVVDFKHQVKSIKLAQQMGSALDSASYTTGIPFPVGQSAPDHQVADFNIR
jgi:hypothetical protein